MVWNCTDPVHYVDNPVWQATNAVLLPVQFCFGMVGSVLTIVVLNGAHMRTSNAIYVYLTALAALDFLTLAMTIPTYLRDMEIIPLEVGFSEDMATYLLLYNGFGNIVQHSSIWVIVFVALVRYVAVSRPFRKRRWTRISASRIIVFLIVLACVVVDFARFFEFEVVTMSEHCFPMLLWKLGNTEFSRGVLFVQVYPWVVTSFNFFLPFFLIGLFTTLIICHMKLWKMTKKEILASPKTSHDEVRTNLVLLAVIGFFVVLELPDAIAQAFANLAHADVTNNQHFKNYEYVAKCFSRTHCCINFILYTLLSPDFRKTMKRLFCRLCIKNDEYYEPIRCYDCFRKKDDESVKSTRRRSSSASTATSSRSPPTVVTPEIRRDSDGNIWV